MNYIFLKIVVNNIYDSTNHFTQQINIISAFYSKEENFLAYID